MVSYSEIIPYTNHVRAGKNAANKNISSSYPFSPLIKDYIVVWLDSNIDRSNEVHQNVILKLQQVINSINTFTDTNECIKFITQMKSEKVFMIISTALGEQIIHLIQDIPQLESIYVFCDDQSDHKSWTQQCNKVKGAFTQIKYICDSLNTEIRRYDNYLTSFSSLSSTDAPIRGLNELDQSFMYSQLLKEILLEIKHDDRKKEMEELVAILRDQYASNRSQLELIDKFKQNYNRDSPIEWYTKEAFIYLTLNGALRTQNINIIIKMGFFIQDLHRQIGQLHSECINSLPRTIYRGQVISSTEFEKMRSSKGGLLSFNNFLSTSINKNASLMFADVDPQQTGTTGVLFEIEIDPSISYASFAILDNASHFNSEEEILFSMNTVFRIGDIEQIKDRLWLVKLTLTNDSDEQLKHVTDSLRQEIGEGTGWHRLGYLMIMLDETEKAEEIYSKLLDITSADKQKERAILYNQFGIINENKSDYKTALSFFQKTADIEEKLLSPDHPDLAVTYNNIAEVYHSMGDYSNALSFHQKALQIRERCLPSNNPWLAATYSNIAGVYLSLGDYQTARLTYQKVREIGEACFASKHPNLATIYDNLASVHTLMSEYQQAFSFYQKAREINQKVLPPNHTLLLTSDSNIASMHDSMGNYSDALSMYEKVLEVLEKSLAPNHPRLAVFNNNIGLVYLNMGNCSKALSYHQKALKIQEKSASHNNPDLATTYSNIGQVYRTMRKFEEACSYYEKALEIDKKCLSYDHPNLATTYNNLGVLYLEMDKHSKALPFCQKALEIRKKRFPPNHPSLASVYNNIGMGREGSGDHSTAISFYRKALEIYKKSSSPNYPELAITYNNMGKTYYSMENYSAALSFFQQTLEVEEKSLGSGHPSLAYTHHHVAYTLEGLQRYKESFDHIMKAVNIATNALEPEDPRLQIFQDHRDIFLLKVLFIIYKINKQVL
jgi:tetratricopeptide (TPR) repeat protein